MLTTVILCSFMLGFILFYRKRQKEMSVLNKMGIPGPKPHWLWGNMTLDKNFYLQLSKWTKEYGKIYGFYQGPLPIIVTTDLDFLKQVTIKQFGNFHGRKELPLQPHPDSEQGINMVSAKGNRWKRLRSIINPTFSAAKLKQISAIVNEKVQIMLENLENETKLKGFEVDILRKYQRLTMDIMTDAAFGLEDHDGSFLKKCLSFFSLVGSNPIVIKLTVIFPEIKRFIYSLTETASIIFQLPHQWIMGRFRKVITYRRQTARKTMDMMQLMLNAVTNSDENDAVQKSNTTEGSGGNDRTPLTSSRRTKTLSNEEVVGQCFVFLLAGYETTSNTLAYLTYLLATNPDKQELLLQEIDEALYNNNNEVTYDLVMKLPYLGMCVSETLRLYPVANSQLNRSCEKSTIVNGISIPAGVLIQADVWSIHHDPDLWGPTDPWKFEPERFSPENKANMNPMQHLPFGSGPRNCVGMRFALMECKLAVVQLLQKYLFQTCERTEVPLRLKEALTISPLCGVYVTLVPRN